MAHFIRLFGSADGSLLARQPTRAYLSPPLIGHPSALIARLSRRRNGASDEAPRPPRSGWSPNRTGRLQQPRLHDGGDSSTGWSTTHPAVLVNCPKEYEAWTRGPARDLLSALNAVDSANAAGDTSALVVALKQTSPAVGEAAHSPMPACADPKGYWTALLMHVNAAASTGASGARPASVTVAMKGVPKIERELRTELKTTTGVKDSL